MATEHVVSTQPASAVSVWIFGRDPQGMAQLGALLSDEGYEVTQVQAATFAVPPGPPPELLVANLEPPGNLDVLVLRELWNRYAVPLICVVPFNNTAMITMAMELPANDVICKPLRREELIGRVASLLSALRKKQPPGIPIVERRGHERREPMALTALARKTASPIKIDDRAKRVYVNGNPVRLSPKEYQLVHLLSSEQGRVFSAQEIGAHLWPNRHRLSGFEVQQYIHFIRRKLETDPKSPCLILTVKGFGYKLAEPEDMRNDVPLQPLAAGYNHASRR